MFRREGQQANGEHQSPISKTRVFRSRLNILQRTIIVNTGHILKIL